MIREFYELDVHDYDEQRVVSALDPLLRHDLVGQVWLVDDGTGAVTGYAIVTWGYSLESGGRDALLDEIYVRDRRRGFGSEVLNQILGAAAAAGASRIFLETEAPNETVRRFYRRHGFLDESSIWMSRVL
jgi:ribosomal protein S18 acetylase RimI-like enzyme